MELNKLSDEELCDRAKSGEIESTEILINRYRVYVIKIARSYFLSNGSFDDLLQEGMIGTFRAIQTYSDGSFRNYVLKCIKNSVLSAVRNSNRDKNKPLINYISLSDSVDGNDKTEIIIDNSFDPEETFINNETEKELRSNIKNILSNYEYNILALFLEGYSYADIGDRTGKNFKSVDNALQRIRKKLSESLKIV